MWSRRFPLKRWEFYQDVMYRENDHWSFVFMLCLAHLWKCGSARLLLSAHEPLPSSQSPVSDMNSHQILRNI